MDNLGITYSICLFQAKITFEEATSTGQAAFFLSESKYAGDIFVCKLGNLDAGETAVLTMAYVVELTVQPDGDLIFELPYVLNTRYSSGQSIQAQIIKQYHLLLYLEGIREQKEISQVCNLGVH